jgi:hypothetical protein
MNSIRLRSFSQLEYRDPAEFLRRLSKIELRVADSDLSDRAKTLRTNRLKEWRELREAALFCVGVSERIGHKVYLGRGESEDYDFVVSWRVDDQQHFAPVQLKEVVSNAINPSASLNEIIVSLEKYAKSEDLVVAVHLNRVGRFDVNDVHVPQLSIGGIWIFGAIAEDQSRWGLWGDFMGEPEGTWFEYPA